MPTLASRVTLTATIGNNGHITIEIPGLTPDFSLTAPQGRVVAVDLDLSDPPHLQQFGEPGTEKFFDLLCSLDQTTHGGVREVLSRIFAAGYRAGRSETRG